jgi:hypothetical protein
MIDITFDTYSDTPPGKDPDTYSPTLKQYHKLLWSKPLPNETVFKLSDTVPGAYLHHHSDLGEFFLSSDAITHTYHFTKSMEHILNQVPTSVLDMFYKSTCVVGAYTIFPSKKIDRKMTINGARGTNAKIKDRFDLTLECIRRHYANEKSPLGEVLLRYSAFFDLFEDFQGYVDFFLLQDLVSDDYSSVKFYLPFDNFERSAHPKNVAEYLSYKSLTLDFVSARSERVKDATS